jgi:hypothetical protein
MALIALLVATGFFMWLGTRPSLMVRIPKWIGVAIGATGVLLEIFGRQIFGGSIWVLYGGFALIVLGWGIAMSRK